MPFYDLRCKSCDQEFNIKASMTEKMEHRIICPDCGSTDMATVYKSAPIYIKSAGSPVNACPNSDSCGASCPHSRGA